MELVDAVDADGEGVANCSFARFPTPGKAFVLYRVIGTGLWPLFQGAPGQ